MVNQLDQTLAALADPTRRRVVDVLRARPTDAGGLAQATRMSGPALSRHLRILRLAGLVEVVQRVPEEDARRRVYRLRRERFDEIQEWLADVQTFWADQLAAYKEHVEQIRKEEEV